MAVSGNQTEEDEGDLCRNLGVASGEAGLSSQGASDDPWVGQTVPGEACPSVGVGACRGEAGPGAGWILEEEAPFQEVQSEAWASAAFLVGACLLEGTVEVHVEVLQRPPEKQECPGQGAWASRGAFQGVKNQVGVLVGRHQEEACRVWAWPLPARS